MQLSLSSSRQAGYTTASAMKMQLITAVGAMAGCGCGLLAGASDIGSIVLPVTAGGFIYIATVSVIPSLFEATTVKQTACEVVAMCLGVLMMVIIGRFE
jgi:zinc transporter 7